MPIFAWLLARPMVIGGIAILAVFGVREGQHFFTERGLRNGMMKLEAKLDAEMVNNAQQTIAFTESQKTVANLTAQIKKMSADIDLMNAKARAIESAANLRVARAIRDGQEAARQLRSPETHIQPGNEAMNVWLQQTLSGL